MFSLLLSFQTLRGSFSMAFFFGANVTKKSISLLRFVHGNRNATAFPCPVMLTEMAEPGVGEIRRRGDGDLQREGWKLKPHGASLSK